MTEHCLDNCTIDEPHYTHSRLINYLKRLQTLASGWVARHRQRKDNQRTYKSIASLDDATLKDIGLRPEDVTWTNKLPDTVNAATELEIIARRRPKRL